MSRVFVAMSGGVDSSVAAFLLKKAGYDVTGIFMRCYNIDGCAERDAEDARRVAAHLNIPFYVFDFEKEYKQKVVNYMIEGYRRGITPNPDVMCNKEIKFGLFLEKALALGADHVATGHYVRLRRNLKFKILNFKLQAARDLNKDQSYFLWTLTQDQLKYCLFPIGDYLKSEVREIARRAALPTAEKKDSQGICFLGKVMLADFLKKHIEPKKGDVMLISSNAVGNADLPWQSNRKKYDCRVIGTHDGAYFYTIGQRHIGVAGRRPVYVAEKDMKTNTVVVAEGESNPALYRKEIKLADVNFINSQHSDILQNVGMSVLARVRYRQPLASAFLYKPKPKNYKLVFESPVKFVAPGQSAVFYSKDGEMLGGGVII